jgi:hypothetical protein
MDHHLIAVPGRPAVEVRRQRGFGEETERIRPALPRGDLFRDGLGPRGLAAFSEQPIGRGLERTLHDRADLGREASAQDQHPVVVHPCLQLPVQVLRLRLVGRLEPVHAAPGSNQAFDVRRRPALGRLHEPCLGSRGRHPRERAHLGVGQRPAHLLPRGAEVDAGAPVEPVRTGVEAVVPPLARVELPDQGEQLVRRRVNPCGEFGNRIAQEFGFGEARCGARLAARRGAWRGAWRRAVN